MQVKALIQSKTFWFNVLKFLGGVLLCYTQVFPDSPDIGIFLMVESVISMILRYQTTQPVSGIITPQP
jgi:hypothetical protein